MAKSLPKVLIINTDIEPDKEEIRNELAKIETRMELLFASSFDKNCWELFEQNPDIKLIVIKVISPKFSALAAVIIRILRKYFKFKCRIIGIVNSFDQCRTLMKESRINDEDGFSDDVGCDDISVERDNAINTIRFAASQILTPTCSSPLTQY